MCSTASQTRTTHRGRLNPRAQHQKQLGRSARMAAAGTERPCRAWQTCRGYKYSGKSKGEARSHDPPPQRGSYRALDALGLRRGVGFSPVRRKRKQRRLPRYGLKALWTCYNFPCSYLVCRLRGPRLGVGEPAMPWRRVPTIALTTENSHSVRLGGRAGGMPKASIRKDRGLCASGANTKP